MRSETTEMSHNPWRSLVARIALGSASASAVGGAIAALAAGYSAYDRITRYENDGVANAVRDLAAELDEEIAETGPDDDYSDTEKTLEAMLTHELDDVKLPGARASIFDSGRWIAGDRTLDSLEPGACTLRMESNPPQRECATDFHGLVLTLAVSAQRERDRTEIFEEAIALGLFIGAPLGAAASLWAARWGLAPLSDLRTRVARIDPHRPRASDLGSRSPVDEVESLRCAVAALVDQLGESLNQSQTFAANAAHELRTPLTSISGEMELLQETASECDRVHLDRVYRQVQGLADLVQRLLVLARPDDDLCNSAEAVDLEEVAEKTLQQFSEGERARISCHIDGDVLVRGDGVLIGSLFKNALSNSLKFSSGEVGLCVSVVGDFACIEVTDRGPGIPAADRDRVFDPFFRAKSTRAGGETGHGLGLALIARVARAHAGRAEFIHSNHGAHLVIRIPAWLTHR